MHAGRVDRVATQNLDLDLDLDLRAGPDEMVRKGVGKGMGG